MFDVIAGVFAHHSLYSLSFPKSIITVKEGGDVAVNKVCVCLGEEGLAARSDITLSSSLAGQ